MARKRRAYTFSLSDSTIKLLDQMSESMDINRSRIIDSSVAWYYQHIYAQQLNALLRPRDVISLNKEESDD